MAINKGSSKDSLVMHLLRCLWLFVALYDIDIVAKHIAGATNQVVDMLSRNRSDQFLSQYPQVSRFPAPLPPSLLLIVSPHRLDIPKLQGVLQRYYLSGIAPTTRNTYAAGQKQYINFVLVPTGPSCQPLNPLSCYSLHT